MPNRLQLAAITAVAIIIMLMAACSSIPVTLSEAELPPVLGQDELLRPYTKLGRINIVREVYVTDFSLEPNLQEWGLKSLRFEAQRMGADALILPEITSRAITIVIFPTFPATEYRATGVAIKFK